MLIPAPPPTMPFLGTNAFEFHDICFLETLAWPPGPLLMDLKLLHCRKNARTDVFFLGKHISRGFNLACLAAGQEILNRLHTQSWPGLGM